MTQWCTQVVRYRIGKRLEFLIGRYQLRSARLELLIQLSNFALALLTLFEFNFKSITCMAKIVLDPTANSTERGNDDRREHKNQKVGEIAGGNVERMARFYKDAVRGHPRQRHGE